jgi:hypothetical protein
MNFNVKFITVILTSLIPLSLFMEIIISLTYHIYYHFHYLFISFHIKSSLLIEVLLLQSYIYAGVYNSKDGSHLQRLT